MEFLLLILAAAVGAALYWDQHTQRSHVARLGEAWAGRAAAFPPIGTICHGDHPPGPGSRRVFGALGFADSALIFVGHRDHSLDFSAPLDTIRWFGLRAHYRTTWNRRVDVAELIVHAETPTGWHVYTFTEGPLRPFAERFGQQTGLAVHDMGEQFEDFGPEPAVYLVRDAAGNWQRITPDSPPPDQSGWQQALYLAPDRLLYGGQHPVLLAAIRRVDMHAVGRLNPFPENLLKIEFAARDGSTRVIGFLLPNAGDWAGVLEQRIDVPVVYHAGRLPPEG